MEPVDEIVVVAPQGPLVQPRQFKPLGVQRSEEDPREEQKDEVAQNKTVDYLNS